MKLMYITNDEKLAVVAEESGVDWIFVDLEINGKIERQGHLDTVISKHKMEDVRKIRNVIKKAKLMVRINPINEFSEQEINSVINNGADIIMLPFFKNKNDVETFLNLIDKRVEVCLLLETAEAVQNIDDILTLSNNIDYIHIGLNDLHLSYKMKFMFEPLASGIVEKLSLKFKLKNVVFGFGGFGNLDEDSLLPANLIINEHYRLGSDLAILSRSFFNNQRENDYGKFKKRVNDVRTYEEKLIEKNDQFFEESNLKMKVIVGTLTEKVLN